MLTISRPAASAFYLQVPVTPWGAQWEVYAKDTTCQKWNYTHILEDGLVIQVLETSPTWPEKLWLQDKI